MSSFVINCFNFTLKPICYMDNGMKIELDCLSAKKIAEAVVATGVDSVTLIGPIALVERLKRDILEEVNVNIITLGGNQHG